MTMVLTVHYPNIPFYSILFYSILKRLAVGVSRGAGGAPGYYGGFGRTYPVDLTGAEPCAV